MKILFKFTHSTIQNTPNDVWEHLRIEIIFVRSLEQSYDIVRIDFKMNIPDEMLINILIKIII